jgi:hypothetical protein
VGVSCETDLFGFKFFLLAPLHLFLFLPRLVAIHFQHLLVVLELLLAPLRQALLQVALHAQAICVDFVHKVLQVLLVRLEDLLLFLLRRSLFGELCKLLLSETKAWYQNTAHPWLMMFH